MTAGVRYNGRRFGDISVTGKNRSAAAKLALLGAAALLVALGGCGRKSGLDLPPSARAPAPPETTAQGPNPPPTNPLGLLDPYHEEQPVAATPRQKKRIILDPILD
jgi:predicted small lipoprotein YifL